MNDLTPLVFSHRGGSSALLNYLHGSPVDLLQPVCISWVVGTSTLLCRLISIDYCRVIIFLYFQWCPCKCNPGADLPLVFQWLSADSCSACLLPGPPGALQQGAPQAHRSFTALFAAPCPRCSTLTHACSAVPASLLSQLPLKMSPLTHFPCLPAECPQQTCWGCSKLPKGSFLFCLNFQLLISFRSHILPNTEISPQRLCLLCSPVQNLSLTVDGLDRAGHPGCFGSVLGLHMTAVALQLCATRRAECRCWSLLKLYFYTICHQ